MGTLAETVVVIWVHAIFTGNLPFSSRTVPAINRHFWSGFPIATFDYRRVVGESMNYGHQHVSYLWILKNMLIIQYTIPWMLILPREDNYVCQNQKELVGIVSNVKYVYIYICMYLYIHICFWVSIFIRLIFIYIYIYIYIRLIFIYIYIYIYWSTASPWDCLECPVVRLKIQVYTIEQMRNQPAGEPAD